jgi:hypothetical protein
MLPYKYIIMSINPFTFFIHHIWYKYELMRLYMVDKKKDVRYGTVNSQALSVDCCSFHVVK